MTVPTISVIMPVYNSERYLDQAVESILHQSFGDFEFLIIDDGSTDSSPARLLNYAQRDPRIRLTRQSNVGCVKTLIQAVPLARGKYIARMDADDVSMPDRFERQVRFLEQNPEYVAVSSKVLLMDPDGAPVKYAGEKQRHEEIDRAHLSGEGGAMSHPAVMIRSDAMRAIGSYRLRADEDLDLFLRLAEYGKLANLPEVLLHYRLHLNSIGSQRYAEMVRSIREAVAEARIRRGLSPLSDSDKLALERHGFEQPSQAAEHHKKWGWWALLAGHRATARKYGVMAVREDPFSLESWRLVLSALRGR